MVFILAIIGSSFSKDASFPGGGGGVGGNVWGFPTKVLSYSAKRYMRLKVYYSFQVKSKEWFIFNHHNAENDYLEILMSKFSGKYFNSRYSFNLGNFM